MDRMQDSGPNMSVVQRVTQRVTTAWASWRKPPWELLGYFEQRPAYKVSIGLEFLIAPLLLFSTIVLIRQDVQEPTLTTLGLAAFIGIVISFAGGVFRVSEASARGVESMAVIGMIFSGHVTEGLVVAVMCVIMGHVQQRLPVHLFAVNIAIWMIYVSFLSGMFWLLGGYTHDIGSPAWLQAGLVAALVYHMVTIPATGFNMVYGGYATWHEAFTKDLVSSTLGLLLSIVPLSLVLGGFLTVTGPLGLLFALGPTLVIVDGFRNAAMAQSAHEEALIDPLTKLSNRRGLDETWDRIVLHDTESGASHWILVGDLDHFKKLNDTLGHDAGDDALVRAARTIKQSVRSQDRCVRFGGEEFVVVITNVNRDGAFQIAERIRENVAAELQGYGTTISIGAHPFGPGDTLDATVKAADLALYASKEHGRNRVSFSSDVAATQS
jgi:diguanylate cyclase (GGDEF)-like protein